MVEHVWMVSRELCGLDIQFQCYTGLFIQQIQFAQKNLNKKYTIQQINGKCGRFLRADRFSSNTVERFNKKSKEIFRKGQITLEYTNNT